MNALVNDRNPRVDPAPGDVLHHRDEVVRVLALVVLDEDDHPLSIGLGVSYRRDTNYGQRSRCTTHIDTWRAWARDAQLGFPDWHGGDL